MRMLLCFFLPTAVMLVGWAFHGVSARTACPLGPPSVSTEPPLNWLRIWKREGFKSPSNLVDLTPTHGVAIQIKSIKATVESGYPVKLSEAFKNISKVPVTMGYVLPSTLAAGTYRITGLSGPAKWTRTRRWNALLLKEALAGMVHIFTLQPGASKAYPELRFPSSHFDMTIPEKYSIHIVRGTKSNTITVTVLAQKAIPANKSLVLLTPVAAKTLKPAGWGKPWHGIQIGIFQTANDRKESSAQVVHVVLRNVRGSSIAVDVTGSTLVDFYTAKVLGPVGFHQNMRKEKKVDLTGKAVPLTSYGQLLRKEGTPKDKTHRFNLKPGRLYKYAQKVVLSARFDMTIPGTYQVQLELTGTHCRSNWLKVKKSEPWVKSSGTVRSVGVKP